MTARVDSLSAHRQLIATAPADPVALAQRIRGLLEGRDRVLLGLVGAPGAGKSTLAASIVDQLGPVAALVPMDGFHLANDVLIRRGHREIKGAPETFDGAGYVALLRRLAVLAPTVSVYAPEFRRGIEESVAGAIEVPAETTVVFTEGNYLLLDREPWSAVPGILSQIWYLDTDENVRLDRLISRHIAFGRDPESAAERATTGADGRNAELIRASRHRADLVLTPLPS